MTGEAVGTVGPTRCSYMRLRCASNVIAGEERLGVRRPKALGKLRTGRNVFSVK